MRKLLYATTALTAAALIAGVAGEAAAQTSTAPTLPQTGASPSPYREQLPAQSPAVMPATPTDKPFVSKSAERIKLGLSGYFQQWGVVTDQSYKVRATPATNDQHEKTNLVDQKHNSEVCVIGQTTLDNGLTIGVNIQIEANSEADQIDESYLFLQSPTMGQLIIGDENNAGYLLHVTAPDGGVSLDSGDLCNIRAFETGTGTQAAGYGGLGANLFDSPTCTTNLRINDNDSGKFTYITPRFAGFQAGVSYIPNLEAGGDNNSALTQIGTGDGGRNSGLSNGVAGGLNYTETFGGLGVQASGGAMWAESFSGGANGSNANLLAYNAGAQFSYAGFSFGGGWLYVPQGQRNVVSAAQAGTTGATAGSPIRSNGTSWTTGVAYEFGPYKVGVDYMKGENNKTTSGGLDRLEQGVVSGTYTMGPGIRLVGGVFYYDWQEENRLSSNNGYGALTGLKLAF
ncbi:MAG: porin [Rhodospirillales bacterium]|nr:porin [Rhodospirillales bacterium]